MEEWKEIRLIDVLETLIDYRGKTPRKTTLGIPLITAKIIKNGRIETPSEFISVDDYDSWMVRGFPKVGDVVLTTEAPLGEVAQLNDNNVALAQRVVTLRGKSGTLDNTYLKYYFLSRVGQQRLKARETGTTVTGIKQSELKEVLVDVPPYEVQVKIASILSSLDDKIEVNRRINENLEQQAQALFKSWFVDFEPFKDGGFVESELGMIPKGWRVGLFIENIDVMPGGTPSTGNSEYWDGGTIPFFSPKDVNGVYCFETEKRITESGLNNCSSHLYPENTLFITARGTVGKICLTGVPMAMNQSNYALVAKEDVGKFYLYLLAQTLVRVLLKKSNGAVFSAITTRDFKEPTIMPPAYIMKKFEKIVSPLFKMIHRTSQESRRLASLRDTLLPRLMSGEIRVDEINVL